MQTKTLITWGRHPSHGNVWLKLSHDTFSNYRNARRREGWEVVVLEKGQTPC